MSQGIFAVVGQSLAEFREAVQGEPGRDVGTIGSTQGDIPDLIRQTIRGMADVLRWLHRAADEARSHVIAADALLALIRTGGDAVGAFPQGIEIGGMDELLRLPPGVLAGIDEAIDAAQDGVESFARLAQSILPPVEDLDAVRSEIVLLLGERQGPQAPGAGALGALMLRIGITK
jgi:hypothetical protein